MSSNRLEVPKRWEETQSDPKTPDPNCLDREERVAATAADVVPGAEQISSIPKSRKEKPPIPSWHGKIVFGAHLTYDKLLKKKATKAAASAQGNKKFKNDSKELLKILGLISYSHCVQKQARESATRESRRGKLRRSPLKPVQPHPA